MSEVDIDYKFYEYIFNLLDPFDKEFSDEKLALKKKFEKIILDGPDLYINYDEKDMSARD